LLPDSVVVFSTTTILTTTIWQEIRVSAGFKQEATLLYTPINRADIYIYIEIIKKSIDALRRTLVAIAREIRVGK